MYRKGKKNNASFSRTYGHGETSQRRIKEMKSATSRKIRKLPFCEEISVGSDFKKFVRTAYYNGQYTYPQHTYLVITAEDVQNYKTKLVKCGKQYFFVK